MTSCSSIQHKVSPSTIYVPFNKPSKYQTFFKHNFFFKTVVFSSMKKSDFAGPKKLPNEIKLEFCPKHFPVCPWCNGCYERNCDFFCACPL